MIAFYTSERQEYGMDNIIGLMGAMEDEIAPLCPGCTVLKIS